MTLVPIPIDDATRRRLVYVKKLFMHGHEHALSETEFDRMIAIHHLDNAVELLLKCAATHRNIPFKALYVQFPDLWGRVDEEVSLPKKNEMFRLHELRSDIQHWGISSFSTEVVKNFDTYVLDFLKETLPRIFGLKFDELFMSCLIEDTILKTILTHAEGSFDEEDYRECIIYASAAFNRAKDGQIDKVRETPYVSIPQSELVLRLGIDYMKYQKYLKLCHPEAYWQEPKQTVLFSLPIGYHEDPGAWSDWEKTRYTREKAFFVLDFVLDCVLGWHL